MRTKQLIFYVGIIIPVLSFAKNSSKELNFAPVETAQLKSSDIEDTKTQLNHASLGLLATNFYYEEPGLMNLKGQMLGAQFKWEKMQEDQANYFSLQAKMQQGNNIKYQGSLFANDKNDNIVTIPYNTDKGKVTIFQYSGYYGRYFALENLNNNIIIPQIGINLYYLNDADDSSDPYDYERQQNYFTIPLRLAYIGNLSDSILKAQFTYHPDVTFSGHNTSKPYGESLDFEQSSGSGMELALDWIKNQWSFGVQYETWSVEKSSMVDNGAWYFMEPENKTNLLSFSASYLF